MKFVIQRVHESSVFVQGNKIGSIGQGLLVLVGIDKGDTEKELNWLVNKLLEMRIFEDKQGRMNRSVQDIKGALLVVPNFTLCADVSQGNRPGFSNAEKPEKAKLFYNKLVSQLEATSCLHIETGEFGANMDVELVNDGPVTIILEK